MDTYILKKQDTFLNPESQHAELFSTVLALVHRFGAVAVVDALTYIGDLEAEKLVV